MLDNKDGALRKEILADVEKQLELKQEQKRRSKKRRGRFRLILTLCLVFAFLYIALYLNGRLHFETVFYQIPSPKTEERIRLVCITDLHNWTFGKGNENLVARIEGLSPDLILIAGDMITAGNDDIAVAVSLCGRLVDIAPVYYSYGNHENKMVYGENIGPGYLEKHEDELFAENGEAADFAALPMIDSRLPDALMEQGVILLNNETDSIQVKGCQVDLAGLNMQSGAYYRYSSQMMEEFLSHEKQNFKIRSAGCSMTFFSAVIHTEELYEFRGLEESCARKGMVPGTVAMIRDFLIRSRGAYFWEEDWETII